MCLSLRNRHEGPMVRPIEEVQQQNNRTLYMDFLYEFHKREEAPSGLTGTYTGLAEEHARWIGKRLREDEELRIGQEMMRKEVEGWHEHGESMKDGYAKYV